MDNGVVLEYDTKSFLSFPQRDNPRLGLPQEPVYQNSRHVAVPETKLTQVLSRGVVGTAGHDNEPKRRFGAGVKRFKTSWKDAKPITRYD
jgi:hypothetical protein